MTTTEAAGTPESDAEPPSPVEDALTAEQLCHAASVALSSAGDQIRETVLLGEGGGHADNVVRALVSRHGLDGLLWLLGDVQLLAVASWLQHRAELLDHNPARCSDVVEVHDGRRVQCQLEADHADAHYRLDRDLPLRWVRRDWTGGPRE